MVFGDYNLLFLNFFASVSALSVCWYFMLELLVFFNFLEKVEKNKWQLNLFKIFIFKIVCYNRFVTCDPVLFLCLFLKKTY